MREGVYSHEEEHERHEGLCLHGVSCIALLMRWPVGEATDVEYMFCSVASADRICGAIRRRAVCRRSESFGVATHRRGVSRLRKLDG